MINNVFLVWLLASLAQGASASSNETSIEIQPRVVGGVKASADDYPWFAASIGSTCGASLVHEDVLLTAAHCDSAFQKGKRVYVGASVRDSSSGGAIRRTIEKVMPHGSFNSNKLTYDYMLLKLDQPVSITPIKLNSQASFPSPGTTVTIMGFGRTCSNCDKADKFFSQIH